MYLLEEFGAERKILLEDHLEIYPVNPWMPLDEPDSGKKAFSNPQEKILPGGLSA